MYLTHYLKSIYFIQAIVLLFACNCAEASTNHATKSNLEQTVPTDNPIDDLYFVAFVYYKDGGKAKMEKFRKKVALLWKKYEMEHLYTVKVSAKNAIIGANTMEQPDEIFIQVARDPAKFGAYVSGSQLSRN